MELHHQARAYLLSFKAHHWQLFERVEASTIRQQMAGLAGCLTSAARVNQPS